MKLEKEITEGLRKIAALDEVIEGQSIKLADKKDRALVQAVTIAYGLLEQLEREKQAEEEEEDSWTYDIYAIEWDTSEWDEEQELASGTCVPDLPEEIDEIEFDHEADFDELADWLENVYGFKPKDFEFEGKKN